MKARRLAWFEAQPALDPARLVFIDETGASTKMARLRGRAPRGARCRAAIPHGHWKTTTLVAALRLEGMTAPMVIERRVLQLRVAGQRVEYASENISLHPVPEPLEHRVPSPEHLGQVPPRAAGARDPQHRLEEKPRVSTSARPGTVDLPRQCGSIRAHCASVNTNLVIHCSLLGA